MPHLYFRSGLIDPWFNLFIFLAIYHCIQLLNNPFGSGQLFSALLAGLFLGAAVLTKGPAALVVVALTLLAFLVWTRQLSLLKTKYFIIFFLTTLLVSGSWFLIEYAKGNADIIHEFIDYQVRLFQTDDAGHGGPFYFHFVVLLVGCFPASLIFMAAYFRFRDLTPYQRLFRKVMLCLFWVVLLLFSVVKTKIIHYSSLCYFPLTFVAALGLTHYFSQLSFGKILRVLYWIIAIVLTILFVAIGLIEHLKNPLINSGVIADEFAIRSLQSPVKWNGSEFLIGVLFIVAAALLFAGIIKRRSGLVYSGIIMQFVFVYLAIAVIIPKVELYSQHAAISFYKACAKQHCHVETHGFKSYAYLFYSNRKKEDFTNPDQVKFISDQLDVMEKEGHSRLSSYATSNLLWMEYGKIDRPAYLVLKVTQEKDLLGTPGFTKLYDENGYSFFVRMPSSDK